MRRTGRVFVCMRETHDLSLACLRKGSRWLGQTQGSAADILFSTIQLERRGSMDIASMFRAISRTASTASTSSTCSLGMCGVQQPLFGVEGLRPL
jgi:hypothetical protein